MINSSDATDGSGPTGGGGGGAGSLYNGGNAVGGNFDTTLPFPNRTGGVGGADDGGYGGGAVNFPPPHGGSFSEQADTGARLNGITFAGPDDKHDPVGVGGGGGEFAGGGDAGDGGFGGGGGGSGGDTVGAGVPGFGGGAGTDHHSGGGTTPSGGGGGGGFGGAVLVDKTGTLVTYKVTFSHNSAKGGDAGKNLQANSYEESDGGSGYGSAIFNDGTYCDFSGTPSNFATGNSVAGGSGQTNGSGTDTTTGYYGYIHSTLSCSGITFTAPAMTT